MKHFRMAGVIFAQDYLTFNFYYKAVVSDQIMSSKNKHVLSLNVDENFVDKNRTRGAKVAVGNYVAGSTNKLWDFEPLTSGK